MGFYDAKGVWRSDGDGFYDAKGNWVSPGGAFYDAKGYLRSPGDGFYDAKGNWVNPGEAFYDGAGELQTGYSVGVAGTGSPTLVLTAGVLLFLPVFLLWMLMAAAIDWLASHLYLVFAVYALLDAAGCMFAVRGKRLRGVRAAVCFAGNYLRILSLAYVLLLYAAPYVLLRDASLGSLFEATLSLAAAVGAIAVLRRVNDWHGNAILGFFLDAAFFAAVVLILRSCSGEVRTLEAFAALYHVDPSELLRLLFGAALQGV